MERLLIHVPVILIPLVSLALVKRSRKWPRRYPEQVNIVFQSDIYSIIVKGNMFINKDANT